MSNGEEKIIRKSIMTFGDYESGKSSILHAHQYNEGKKDNQTTISLDFYTKKITTSDLTVIFKIFDTSGFERYRAISLIYAEKAHGIIFVYNVTSRTSFQNVDKWIEEACERCSKDTRLVLVGNKVELQSNIAVSTQEGQALADRHGMLFFETSKEDYGSIDRMFTALFNSIIASIDDVQ